MIGRICLVTALLVFSRLAPADPSAAVTTREENELWRRTIDLATHGDFEGAAEAIRQIREQGDLTKQVSVWLTDYEAEQARRRELDRADFEKYVGYAKARIERKEYYQALSWALAALDCTRDRDAFLESDWLLDLVSDSLSRAEGYRQKHEWRPVWRIYSLLAELYEHEPRYQKLEREAVNHLRLENMFKEGSHWEEQIDQVRWKDAEEALQHLAVYYVEPIDFQKVAESGLEQLQLLADSKSAQKQFEGLQDESARHDFRSRLRERLDQIRSAPSLDWRGCLGHFRRVVKKINEQTVRLPEPVLVNELMRGALEPLDDFTTIIWPRASKEFEKHTRGNFPGVGISIIKNRDEEIEVVTPLEDTPAYRAGIQAGDIIIRVDGKSIKGFSVNKVVETITGPKGTPVTLTIRRNGKEIEFPLVRARVKIRSVKGVRRDPLDEERWDHWLDRERRIAYIRITNFQKNTVEDVKNALAELRGLRGLVLDLRGNPGGLLDSAWQITSLFLSRGDTIVETRGRHKREDQSFHAPSNGAYADVPLAVLVDERSASASEIVSGALRDNGRATVIGERTFGKFSVQNLIPLGHSGAKLKLTTARYYLPNGDSLHRDPLAETWGVTPDIEVRLVPKEKINILKMQREANLLGPRKPAKQDVAKGEKDDHEGKEQQGDQVAAFAPAAASKKAETDQAGIDDGKKSDSKAEAETEKNGEDSDEAKLPPLKQPDENNRPKVDAQLDTALLLMRLTLVGTSHPTLAAADSGTLPQAKQP